MKEVRIGLVFNDKKINLEVRKLSKLGMLKGLMFTKREKAKALLFDHKNLRIHSLFVGFPFLALWLDGENRVVDLKIIDNVKFNIPSVNPSLKLVEIPFNSKYDGVLGSIVGKETFKKK